MIRSESVGLVVLDEVVEGHACRPARPGPVLTVVVVLLSATPPARFVASVHPVSAARRASIAIRVSLRTIA